MKPSIWTVPIPATMVFLFTCAPASQPPEALPSDAEARAIVEGMLAGWDAAVAAGDTEANSTVYTVDAVRMQPDMPALVGQEAIQAWMQTQAETYSFEGSNEIIEARALSPDWILFRSEGSFVGTPRADGDPLIVEEKWLSIAQRQRDGTWRMYRDAGSSRLPR